MWRPSFKRLLGPADLIRGDTKVHGKIVPIFFLTILADEMCVAPVILLPRHCRPEVRFHVRTLRLTQSPGFKHLLNAGYLGFSKSLLISGLRFFLFEFLGDLYRHQLGKTIRGVTTAASSSQSGNR